MRAHQGSLAGAVGPEHADELAGADGEAYVRENVAAVNFNGGAVEFDDVV